MCRYAVHGLDNGMRREVVIPSSLEIYVYYSPSIFSFSEEPPSSLVSSSSLGKHESVTDPDVPLVPKPKFCQDRTSTTVRSSSEQTGDVRNVDLPCKKVLVFRRTRWRDRRSLFNFLTPVLQFTERVLVCLLFPILTYN